MIFNTRRGWNCKNRECIQCCRGGPVVGSPTSCSHSLQVTIYASTAHPPSNLTNVGSFGVFESYLGRVVTVGEGVRPTAAVQFRIGGAHTRRVVTRVCKMFKTRISET